MLNDTYKGGLYIVSAYREGLSIGDNKRRHESLKKQMELLEIKFFDNEGSYNGVEELSLTLVGTSRLAAHHYAGAYGQPHFMRLEPHGGMYKAYFVDTDTGKEDYAGYFRSMSKPTIRSLQLDWTYSEGTFYTIWHTDTTDMLQFQNECEDAYEKLTGNKATGLWG